MSIDTQVRWSDNTSELARNLAQGLQQIQATQQSVDKLVTSLSGEAQIRAADRWSQALTKLGDSGDALAGVQRLTSAEIDRGTVIIDKAIAKYQALGLEAPKSFTDLSAALRAATGGIQLAGEASDTSSGKVSAFGKLVEELKPKADNAQSAFSSLKGTLTEVWESPTAALQKFSTAIATDLSGSLGALGVLVGAAGGTLAALGVASFELAERAASVGGALNDMSEKTGIAVPALSKLSGAVQIAGGTLDQVSNAIFLFQRNLAEGGDKFAEGVQRLGLSVAQLKAQSPDEQFLSIAAAVKQVEDPAQRAAAAMELFGRQGRDLLPLLNKPLDELIQKSHDLGLTWTTEDAAAAEEFEMQTNALRLEVQQFAISVGRDLIPQMTEAVKVLEATGSAAKAVGQGLAALGSLATGFGAQLQEAAVEAGSLSGQILGFVDSTLKAQTAVKGFKGPIDDYVNAIHAGLPTQADMKTSLRELEEQYKKIAEAQKEAARAQEAQRQLWETYNSVGLSVVDTIGKMDGAQVEAIKFDLRRGEQVETLTKIYGVHKEQIQAIEQEQKFLASIVDTTTKSYQGMTLAIPNLTTRTDDFRASLDTLFATLNQFNGGLSVAGDTLDHVTIPAFSELPNVIPEGTKAIHDALSAVDKLSFGLDHVRLSIAGVSLDPLIKEFDKFLASESGKSVLNLLSGIGLVPSTTAAGKAITAGITVGAGILASATNNAETKTGQVLHTTAQGAEIGAQFGGPIGAAAGAGIGALVGALKVNPEEIAARGVLEDFIKGYGTLGDAIKGVGAQYALLGKSGTEAQADLQAALDASHKSTDAESAALSKISGVLDQAKKRAQDVADSIAKVGPAFGSIVNGAAITKDSINDLGTQAVTVFAAQVAGGLSVADALKADGPALQSLSDSYKALGLDVGNVALQNLLMQNTITQGNPDLLNAVGGLASEMEALNKLGVLNTDTFEAMERTGTATYAQLQASVVAVGGSTKDALIPMQGFLHDAANEADQLGIPLDDNTQLLVDQSKELGIWRETGKDATKALNDGIQSLIDKMSELIDRLTGQGGLTDAFSGIPDSINVKVNFLPGDNEAGVGFVPVPVENSFATGTKGLRDFGTGSLAMLHGREAVLTEGEYQRAQSSGGTDLGPIVAMLDQSNRFIRQDLHKSLARAVRDEVAKVRTAGRG